MAINVFGIISSSYDNCIKIHTSLFVQKPYLRTKYIESNIEEDIDLINQFRIVSPYKKQLQKTMLILNLMIPVY